MKNSIKFTLLLLALLLPATATAQDFEVDGFFYNYWGEGVAVAGCVNPTGSLTIPETVTYNGTTYTVTAIGDDAFNACSDLTSIEIPNSVTYIGVCSLYDCYGLNNITLGNSVTEIGNCAFFGCANLTRVNIPNSVETIGGAAFAWCSGLTNINIPYSVTSIGNSPFNCCSRLTGITVANDNPVYDSRDNCNAIIETASNSLIQGCQNTIIPNSIYSIADYAFLGCSNLVDITIPNSVVTIGEGAYSECARLANITCLAMTPPVYNGDAFDSNTYTKATLKVPKSSKTAYEATDYWKNFTNIYELSYDFEVDGIYYKIEGNEAIVTYEEWCIEFGKSDYCGDVTIPSNVTYNGKSYPVTAIDDWAFNECSGLTSVHIPNSVTIIGGNAFCECSSLTDVTIPNSITHIGDCAFAGCSGLTSIVLPNSITSLPKYSFFGCSDLTNIEIPNSVTIIGDNAFTGCSKLTSIDIPNSVTSIGKEAFYFCTGLTIINIPNSVTSIGDCAFQDCTGLTSVTIPNSVVHIGCSAFFGTPWDNNLPDGLNYVGLVAYKYKGVMPYETSIVLREGTLGIAGGAFSDFPYQLTSISIPNSVIAIGGLAFDCCYALKDVYCYVKDASNIQNYHAFGGDADWELKDQTLYVPYNSAESYRAAPAWSDYFASIVEMDPVPAESIELDRNVAILLEDETVLLTATVLPEEASNKAISWASSNPNVVSVDENGLVTAIGLGTATISAMTTDGSNLSASCVVTVKSLSADNAFVLPDTTVLHGENITIPVELNNTEAIMAFQTDIYLPEGFTVATDENDEFLISPSSRLSSDHEIMADRLNDGSVRIICYTATEQLINGNEGTLFYITIATPDNAGGNYPIYLRNSRLTTAEFNEIRTPDVGAVLTVNTFIPGDANDSHSVNVTDIVVTAQYILQRNPSPFIFEAADMNGDGEVTVTDIILIAHSILYSGQHAMLRAPALMASDDSMSGESISIAPGETQTVSIVLNNEMDYSAFQLDLMLPVGMTASNFQLTDRACSHVLDVETLRDGMTRVLCYSPAIDAFDGSNGALLTFDVTATSDIAGNITVDGIELVTTNCQTKHLNAFTIGVNNATSLGKLTADKTIARVDYFNVAGQRIDRPDSGVTLVVTTYTDGTRTTTKLIR